MLDGGVEMKFALTLAAAAVLSLICTAGADPLPVYMDSTQPIDARVTDLLSRMTTEEKISLVHANSKFTTAAIPRLGLPVRWMSDGPHGVREDIGPDTWAPMGHTDDFSTCMPCGSALAATWNVNLAEIEGQTIGEEARRRGKQIMLGPAVNIQRTPLGGRNFEYMGEDPLLAGKMAAAYIHGVQSQAFRRQQPGNQSQPHRRAHGRAHPARNLPARFRNRGKAGRRAGRHGRL
jgi:beta-glucosidase